MIKKNLHSALILALAIFSMVKPVAAKEPAPTGFSVQDLLVTPTRIVFEGPTRSAELALINRSNKARSYSISFVQCRMNEDGQIAEIDSHDQPGHDERSAAPYLRFTPRRVELEPGQTQMVRLQLRKPSELPEGEYRSHLNLRLIPSAEDAATPDSESRGISVRLVPIYGVTIPVIVRHGALTASTRLTGLHLKNNSTASAPILSFAFERDGSRSAYGDIEALWKPQGGKPVSIGGMKGIAVYTPNPKRNIILQLTPPKGLDLRGGQLIVRYIDPDKGEKNILAESQLSIQ
ncbi:MAG: molecular chaperone [Chlorobiaceae bacterium]|nr:molecular chaperone [Chlorobiaceae bacterium]